MEPKKEFRIAITGDTGFDIYTENAVGYAPGPIHSPESAYNLHVPSGAEFTALTFETLLANCPFSIQHWKPTNVSETPKHLVECKWFDPTQDAHLTAFRVSKVHSLQVLHAPSTPHVFSKLQAVSPSKMEITIPFPEAINLLVIHDGQGGWRQHKKAEDDIQDGLYLVEKFLTRKKEEGSKSPTVLVNLTYDLPVPEQMGNGELCFPFNSFWGILAQERFVDQVCIVCSASMLRREGAAISRRLSWEQTVEDLACDLLLFDKLKILSKFKHLVIRFGIAGAIHIKFEGGIRTADLVFAPFAKNGIYRDPLEQGTLGVQNVLLVAALAKILSDNPSSPDFVTALKSGLLAAMYAFDRGYKPWSEDCSAHTNRNWLIEHLLGKKNQEKSATDAIQNGYPNNRPRKKDHILGHTTIPPGIFTHPPGSWSGCPPTWEILKEAIGQKSTGPADSNDGISKTNIGMAITQFGLQAVFNCDWDKMEDKDVLQTLERPVNFVTPDWTTDYMTLPVGQRPALPSVAFPVGKPVREPKSLHVPIITFGQLTLVEREEIEAIRSIANLLHSYHHERDSSQFSFQPISIAVFGPPGSGKSFAVKQIAEEVNKSLRIPKKGLESIEYNVAHFRTPDDLGDVITRAGVINNQGRTPLVFFDEFDCDFKGQPLGWLKYFLAPMQDGTFYGVRQTIKIARAIFVFAGGIHHSFEKFDPSFAALLADGNSEKNEKGQNRQKQFASQKGPDFISRLRGHINILPVNVNQKDRKLIVRRSIILRGLLERGGGVTKVGKQHIANIDPDIVYALLTLDRYRHGVRSMEAVLQMCSRINGRIEKASLPSRVQLNMHVDAEDFFIRMYRGRYRTPPNLSKPLTGRTEDQQKGNLVEGTTGMNLQEGPKGPKVLESSGLQKKEQDPASIDKAPEESSNENSEVE